VFKYKVVGLRVAEKFGDCGNGQLKLRVVSTQKQSDLVISGTVLFGACRCRQLQVVAKRAGVRALTVVKKFQVLSDFDPLFSRAHAVGRGRELVQYKRPLNTKKRIQI